jgi:hypothetical protein
MAPTSEMRPTMTLCHDLPGFFFLLTMPDSLYAEHAGFNNANWVWLPPN